MKPIRSGPVIGWREWVSLPDLGIDAIKAKVDTGARTSAIHAIDIVTFQRRGVDRVRFRVHPIQRESRKTIETEAEMIDRREIKSSVGHVTERPVISTTIELKGRSWEIELTLVGRDEMGFRMLLGREAIRGQFVVDPGASFLAGPGPRRRKKKTSKQAER